MNFDAINAFFEAVNQKGPVILGRIAVTAAGVVTIMLGLAFLLAGNKNVQGIVTTVATKGMALKK